MHAKKNVAAEAGDRPTDREVVIQRVMDAPARLLVVRLQGWQYASHDHASCCSAPVHWQAISQPARRRAR